MWNLQRLGQGFAVLSSVESRSKQALQEVLAAQSALAETDFEKSRQSFADAQVLFQQAQNELQEALSTSRYILRVIDVTGSVKSGEQLLALGEALTTAGQHLSAALEPLLEQPVVLNDSASPDQNLVEAVTVARDEVGLAVQALRQAEKYLPDIESPYLPADIEEQVAALRISVPRAREILSLLHEQSNMYLYLLGAQRDRQYLLVFTNNHELRPVGGFIGTLGLVNVDRGKVENIDVQSVYDPDGQLREFIAPPNPLLSIVDRWYLRDANWFIDWRVSAQKIAQFFEKEGGPTVDGVMLFTPDVLRRLLTVTGPIEVPGHDVTVSADNFIEVTQSKVTYNFDPVANKPKQFLADLAPVLLNRLFAGEASSKKNDVTSKLETLTAFSTSLQQKELVLYFADAAARQALRKVGWDGGVPEEAQGFLHVNNANIGGHKSDQFIEQEIDYRTTLTPHGDAEVVLTIRRTHHGPREALDILYPEDEDPAYKDNVIYQRVLVPKGSRLLEARGFTPESEVPATVIHQSDTELQADPEVAAWQSQQERHSSGTTIGKEAGYTFFANWIITKPGQTSVTLYRYHIPHAVSLPSLLNLAEKYSVFISKQAGALRTSIRASIAAPAGYRFVHTMPAAGTTQEADHDFVYRGDLRGDVVIGGVIERAQ